MNAPTSVAGTIFSTIFPFRRDSKKPDQKNEKKGKSPKGPFNFTGLPAELQLKIINLLPAKYLLRFERISKDFQVLANDRLLWLNIGHVMNIDITNMDTQEGKKLICSTLRITHEIVKRNLLPGIDTFKFPTLETQTQQVQQKKLSMGTITQNKLNKEFDVIVRQFLDKELIFINQGTWKEKKGSKRFFSLLELLNEMKILMEAGAEYQNKIINSYQKLNSFLCESEKLYVLDMEHINAIIEFDCLELTNFLCKVAPKVYFKTFKPFDIKYLRILSEMLKNESPWIDDKIFEEIAKSHYYLEYLIVIINNKPKHSISKNKIVHKSFEKSLTYALQRLIDEDRKVEDVIPLFSIPNIENKLLFDFFQLSFDFFEENITENKKKLAQAFLDHNISLSAASFNKALYSSPDFMRLLLSFNNPFPISVDFKCGTNGCEHLPYFYLKKHFEIANILNDAGIKVPNAYLQDAISSWKDPEFMVQLLPLYKNSQHIFNISLPISITNESYKLYIERFKLLISYGISLSLYIPNLHSHLLSPLQIQLSRFLVESGVKIDQNLFKESIRFKTSTMANNLTSLYDDVFFIDIRFPKLYFTQDVHFEIAQAYVNKGFRLPTSYLAQAIKSYNLPNLRKLVPLYLNQSPMNIKIPPEFDNVKTSALAVILKPLLFQGEEIVDYYLNPKTMQESIPSSFKTENPNIQLNQKREKINFFLLNSNYTEALLETDSIPYPDRSFVFRDIIKVFFLRENNIRSCEKFIKILLEKVNEEDLSIVLEILSLAKIDQKDKNKFALDIANYLLYIDESKYKKWQIECNIIFPNETHLESSKNKKEMPLLVLDNP